MFSQLILLFPSRRFRRQDVRHGNAAQQCFGQQFIGKLLTHVQSAGKGLKQPAQFAKTMISPAVFHWHVPIMVQQPWS